MNAIIYARYSPRPNAPAESINVQLDKCRAYAAAKGWTVVGEYVDEGKSGASSTREEFRKAIDQCKEVGGVFLVYNLSRFARSMKIMIDFHEQLTKADCQLASVSESVDTTTAVGRLQFNILGAFNQFFRDQLSESTSAALQAKIERGEAVGSIAPFGFEFVDGYRVENPQEQEIIDEAMDCFDANMNNAEAARQLNDLGYTTRDGTPWNHSNIRTIRRIYEARSLAVGNTQQ